MKKKKKKDLNHSLGLDKNFLAAPSITKQNWSKKPNHSADSLLLINYTLREGINTTTMVNNLISDHAQVSLT